MLPTPSVTWPPSEKSAAPVAPAAEALLLINLLPEMLVCDVSAEIAPPRTAVLFCRHATSQLQLEPAASLPGFDKMWMRPGNPLLLASQRNARVTAQALQVFKGWLLILHRLHTWNVLYSMCMMRASLKLSAPPSADAAPLTITELLMAPIEVSSAAG